MADAIIPPHDRPPAPYKTPDSDLPAVAARTTFLRVVRVRVPDVLETLAGEPFRAFKELVAERGLQGMRLYPWLQEEAGRDAAQADLPALHDWAQQWHLDVWWVRHRALGTLDMWRKNGRPMRYKRDTKGRSPDGLLLWGWLDEAEAVQLPYTDEDLHNKIVLPDWNPLYQTRGEAAQAMRKAFNKQLKEYLDRIETMLGGARWQEARERRNWGHFHWLVDVQVAGRRPHEIAKREDLPVDTIRDGLKELAGLLDLPLRRHQAGRPRSSSMPQ